MALFRCDVASGSMGMYTTINVIIPDSVTLEDKKDLKVVYLLHGLSDNSSAWIRNTSIERYATDYNVAVIMPEVQRSFYTDMAYGLKYFTFISKDLPEIASKFFSLSTARENSYIAGLSMGGYGATKIALSCPEQYTACASFSGVLDINIIFGQDLASEDEIYGVTGSLEKVADKDNLFELAKECNKIPKDKKPNIFVTCGTEDFLYEGNVKFRDYMETLDFDFKFQEWTGEHTWDFWDKSIVLALKHFTGK